MERRLYQKLSQYYPLGRRQEWTRPSLLLNRKYRHNHSTYRHFAYPNSQCWKISRVSRPFRDRPVGHRPEL